MSFSVIVKKFYSSALGLVSPPAPRFAAAGLDVVWFNEEISAGLEETNNRVRERDEKRKKTDPGSPPESQIPSHCSFCVSLRVWVTCQGILTVSKNKKVMFFQTVFVLEKKNKPLTVHKVCPQKIWFASKISHPRHFGEKEMIYLQNYLYFIQYPCCLKMS